MTSWDLMSFMITAVCFACGVCLCILWQPYGRDVLKDGLDRRSALKPVYRSIDKEGISVRVDNIGI